ncbi:MAG TPA: VOC family protein [Armatimonadota bacterium]|jgi:catechol 2,3-dioxygenase-like lactoylglutathione lyase family enzyme
MSEASPDAGRTRCECTIPILSVTDLQATIDYFVRVLGFKKDFDSPEFASVSRNGSAIYLSRGGQGQPGAWVWMGVEDAEAIYQEYQASGALIDHEPRNYPWALEFRVKDPDGNTLRIGSEPRTGEPYDQLLP